MTSYNWDAAGALVIEIRSDADVAAIVGANPTSSPPRVRVRKPAPVTTTYDGDAQGPGHYRAFVVLQSLGYTRLPRAPIQRPRYVARCYGRDSVEADQLARVVSNAIHQVGPRVTGGLGIYASFDDGGGEQDQDPDTQQPYVPVFIDLTATTVASVA